MRQLSDAGLYPVQQYIHPGSEHNQRSFPRYQFPADCYGYFCPKRSGSSVEDYGSQDLQKKYEGLTQLSNIILATFVLMCSGKELLLGNV